MVRLHLDEAVLLIVGEEILEGRRRDRHLEAFATRLTARGVRLAWAGVIGDGLQLQAQWLRRVRDEGMMLFCCGGIGATPDDHTRQAAALAWGRPLTRHPEAATLIETRFGAEAHPHRIRMADLPEGCGLIPNPINTIPGFYLERHHFLPGFPDMAHPMLDWLLQQRFTLPSGQETRLFLELPGGREGDLIPLLEALEHDFPGIRTTCLPRLGEGASLELGVKGRDAQRVEAAMGRLRERLSLLQSIQRPGGVDP